MCKMHLEKVNAMKAQLLLEHVYGFVEPVVAADGGPLATSRSRYYLFVLVGGPGI